MTGTGRGDDEDGRRELQMGGEHGLDTATSLQPQCKQLTQREFIFKLRATKIVEG